jgi:hypothetical protein
MFLFTFYKSKIYIMSHVSLSYNILFILHKHIWIITSHLNLIVIFSVLRIRILDPESDGF